MIDVVQDPSKEPRHWLSNLVIGSRDPLGSHGTCQLRSLLMKNFGLFGRVDSINMRPLVVFWSSLESTYGTGTPTMHFRYL